MIVGTEGVYGRARQHTYAKVVKGAQFKIVCRHSRSWRGKEDYSLRSVCGW